MSRERPQPQNETQALLQRIGRLEQLMGLQRQTGPTSLQILGEGYEEYDDPTWGEVHINGLGLHKVAAPYSSVVYYHADEKNPGEGQWYELGNNVAVYEIKVFEDTEAVEAGPRWFVWEIPEDLDRAVVVKVEGYLTTAGACEVGITKRGGGSILTSPIVINGLNSKDAASQPEVAGDPGTEVRWGDHLEINVLAAGGMGLGVIVYVAGAGVAGATLRGLKGDPGGVTAWRGTWTTATAYTTGQAVTRNGTSFVARTNHTSGAGNEPGIGATWEDNWQVLSEQEAHASVVMGVNANGYQISSGQKGHGAMPFDGQLASAMLFADKAGNATVDIKKTTFLNYPTATSITGGNPLTLSGDVKRLETAMTGWDKNFAEDDIYIFEVSGVSVITRLNLSLKVNRA